MQIRIGNKQDEQACRDMVKAWADSENLAFDLDKADADLRNIELSYLGRDGIYVVVEDDQTVIAFAAAARGASEDVCLLRRLIVLESSRRRGLGGKLVEQTVFFAKNLDYATLAVELAGTPSASLVAVPFLNALGFQLCSKSPSESTSSTTYERTLI